MSEETKEIQTISADEVGSVSDVFEIKECVQITDVEAPEVTPEPAEIGPVDAVEPPIVDPIAEALANEAANQAALGQIAPAEPPVVENTPADAEATPEVESQVETESPAPTPAPAPSFRVHPAHPAQVPSSRWPLQPLAR